jgi:hypothetical protein
MIKGHLSIAASDLTGCANSNRSTVRLLLALAVLTSSAFGQWLGYPAPGTPWNRDGSPNLTTKAPRVKRQA